MSSCVTSGGQLERNRKTKCELMSSRFFHHMQILATGQEVRCVCRILQLTLKWAHAWHLEDNLKKPAILRNSLHESGSSFNPELHFKFNSCLYERLRCGWKDHGESKSHSGLKLVPDSCTDNLILSGLLALIIKVSLSLFHKRLRAGYFRFCKEYLFRILGLPLITVIFITDGATLLK